MIKVAAAWPVAFLFNTHPCHRRSSGKVFPSTIDLILA